MAMMHYMPFGKYKGKSIRVVPDEYLHWLLSIELRPPLAEAVRVEAQRRMETAILKAGFEPLWAFAIIGAGVKSLAKKHHPDAGGLTEDMAAINCAAEWLRVAVEKHAG